MSDVKQLKPTKLTRQLTQVKWSYGFYVYDKFKDENKLESYTNNSSELGLLINRTNKWEHWIIKRNGEFAKISLDLINSREHID